MLTLPCWNLYFGRGLWAQIKSTGGANSMPRWKPGAQQPPTGRMTRDAIIGGGHVPQLKSACACSDWARRTRNLVPHLHLFMGPEHCRRWWQRRLLPPVCHPVHNLMMQGRVCGCAVSVLCWRLLSASYYKLSGPTKITLATKKMAACRYRCGKVILHRRRCIGRPSKRPVMQHASLQVVTSSHWELYVSPK